MEDNVKKRREYELIKFLEGLSLNIHITCFISNSKTLFHWHGEIEILLVLEGPIIINTENAQFTLEKNDIFILNSNEAHCIQKTSELSAALIIQIAPGFCSAYYPELKQLRFLDRHFKENGINSENWNQLFAHIKNMIAVLQQRKAGYHFEIMSTMNLIFAGLLQNVQYEKVSEERHLTEARNMNRLNRIISFLQDNFTNKISLADLAEKEKLDMYYLSHFIKKHLGMSFQQYLNKLRLSKAIELLMKTSNKNIDICYESGFSDYRYLCKEFMSEYGCTPSQYKERNKQKYINIEDFFVDVTFLDQYVILNLTDSLKMFDEYLEKQNSSEDKKAHNVDQQN